MTVRELINILIDVPNKDKPVEIEYCQCEVEENNNGYEWNQLYATSVCIHDNGCSIEAHPKKYMVADAR